MSSRYEPADSRSGLGSPRSDSTRDQSRSDPAAAFVFTEADVFLLERAVEAIGGNPAKSSLLAAKRYRAEEHRSFHRGTSYVEGRRTPNSRDSRAMAKKTSHGRSVAAGQWAYAEWDALNLLWKAGVPVPYPVQVDGTELLMEFIDDGEGS